MQFTMKRYKHTTTISFCGAPLKVKYSLANYNMNFEGEELSIVGASRQELCLHPEDILISPRCLQNTLRDITDPIEYIYVYLSVRPSICCNANESLNCGT